MAEMCVLSLSLILFKCLCVCVGEKAGLQSYHFIHEVIIVILTKV